MKDKKNKIRFFLAQLNITVGDISGNKNLIIHKIKEASRAGADIIIFPEMTITGYPPEDLLHKKRFVDSNLKALKEIAYETRGITAVVGYVNSKKDGLYNSAAVLADGKILASYDKINLPNYGVFDEKRYFKAGNKGLIFKVKGTNMGLSICEDLWQPCAVLEKQKRKMDFLINMSASPYHMEKWKERTDVFKKQAKKYGVIIVYCNLVGGQDELVFDGHSLVINEKGSILLHGSQFKEKDMVFELPSNNKIKKEKLQVSVEKTKILQPEKYEPFSLEEEVYEALVMGTHDYVKKNGFKKVVLGLSGGIDSALVAVIAADALGAENVNLVFMPSKFSSVESHDDAEQLSNNLKIKMKNIDIQETVDTLLGHLKHEFKNTKTDTTEENLQARIRGNINMALSNKFNWLVLTTGNKSEMSTGYATLYGDMAGGFAVIKDVPKTLVYRISKMINNKAGKQLIPENIINKAPTAELKFNQKDSDSLPEYEVLDKIIEDYVENDKTYGDLKGKYDDEILRRVIRLIDINEYKRRQAPPGIKITPKAFGRDRRMPITNKYRE
ncbi:MAG: NAD+ synthase [bacterium]